MSEADTAPSFGRYRDPVMLGAGGMGAVYRATDPTLDRYVAIKVLTQREPKYVERFRREAQVLAKIMHPSIIQIYEIVGSDEDQADPYIVMEYFDGTPLDKVLKSRGKLTEFEVVNVLRQTAEGLKKAHANNVIHRDIKPANIMVSEIGDVKILDFGIAKLRDAKKDLTGNTVLGTPYYMSPEQAMGQPIDARTDIYSLGITAFHLLTGKRPFEARAKVDVMLMQVKTPLPSVLQFAHCDEKVVAIVEKMCAKKAADRFQSCDELIDAIDALPKSLGGKQREGETTKPDMPKVPPAPRKAVTPVRARTPSKPTSRPDVRRPSVPPPKSKVPGTNRLLLAGAGAGLAVVLVVVAVALGLRKPSGAWRVPSSGWVAAGPVRKIHQPGRYGNCIFSSRPIERDKEDRGALREAFSQSEPIYGRCYFARPVGPNKPGEVWQELWVDGVKRAQIIYDPALAEQTDQIELQVSRRHGARIGELSNGKHTLDIWIYRQPDDAENPEPLAAGELIVRK